MYSWNKEKQLRRRPDEDRSESSPGPRHHYSMKQMPPSALRMFVPIALTR